MKLSLCIVGCGGFAQAFVKGVEPLREEIDLFFASRDRSRARTYCNMFQGSGAFGSYQEAAADSRVEAMYLCTPHHLHLEHVTMAARAGKHALVEKPIARTLEEGRRTITAAREAGITLMVAENYRFLAAVRKCKELVDSGAVGNLRLVQFQEETPFQPGGWRSNQLLNGGGMFIDGGIHKVHFLRYLVGEPEQVYTAPLPQALNGHEGEDGLVVVFRWASGVVGLINHSWANPLHPLLPWVSVSGTRGRIYFEMGKPWLRLEQGDSEQTIQLAQDYYGLMAMVREFRDSIREGREPEVSGEEGLSDLAVVLKAYESMKQGAALPMMEDKLQTMKEE
jgi:predicted dehydrogenase